MSHSVLKAAPCRPYIQWRWILEKKPISKSLWKDDVTATQGAVVFAKDHYVTLNYVTGTGNGGKISKDDVVKYLEAGKPEDEVSKARYPNPPELLREICLAMMHMEQQMGRDAIFLWLDWRLEDLVEGEKTPVVVIEWGIKARRGHAARLRNRDKRFSVLPPRSEHPWGRKWGAR